MKTTDNRSKEVLKDKHLLIAVDESEEAKRAVLYVADFVGGFPGFRVTLLSIVQEPEEDFFTDEQERSQWIEGKRKQSIQHLDNYREILLQSGFQPDKVEVKLCSGNSRSLSEAILTFQCEMSCCTIVVGRQHKSKTEEFLFGSVSSQLIHEAKNCAVWVVE